MAPPAWHTKKKSLLNFLTNFFHVFNIILFLSGCGLLSISLWTWLYKQEYIILVKTALYSIIPWILVSAATLSLVVPFLGSWAAAKRNKCLLVLYIFSVLLILVIELVTGGLAWIYRERVQFDLGNTLVQTFSEHYNVGRDHTSAIDSMQQEYKCCGAKTFEEWLDKKWLRGVRSNNSVPDSCCKTVSPHCGVSYHPSNIPYTGCMHRLSDELEQHLVIVCAVSLGISAVPLIGVILACAIYLKMRDHRTSYNGYTRGATSPPPPHAL